MVAFWNRLQAFLTKKAEPVPYPRATVLAPSDMRVAQPITRQGLREVLRSWQSGQRTAAEVQDWAEARYLMDHWEPEDEVSNVVLAHLDGLDMNLVILEDIPFLLEILELPPEGGLEASEKLGTHPGLPSLRKRARGLAEEPFYAPFAEAILNSIFRCAICGEEHDLAELSFGADAPAIWGRLTDEERAASELTSDQCVIHAQGETAFFLRACLEIPIRGTDRVFRWGVWLSLSEKSFLEVCDTWEDPQRVERGPYFGWLTTSIPTYPETVLLKAMVHPRSVGERPWVELEATDHPLALHQREGIDPLELQAKVVEILHTHET